MLESVVIFLPETGGGGGGWGSNVRRKTCDRHTQTGVGRVKFTASVV